WTTPEEREALTSVLATNDGAKIRDALGRLPDVGRIKIPGQRGADLEYAWRSEQDGRQIITVAADRTFLSRPGATTDPSIEFLVGVGVLNLDADGAGTGRIAPAIQLQTEADGSIDITASAADPVELTRVQPR
ncbi:MAG: hypothetical protein R3190_17315, partial [Thermoanaerobaculia bacterium]|nr:hypothetical protein [Thermoanaerobaculia bacterium]